MLSIISKLIILTLELVFAIAIGNLISILYFFNDLLSIIKTKIDDLYTKLKLYKSQINNKINHILDTYFITSFSFYKFIREVEKELAALGIFGVIIAYFESLSTSSSTFSGKLTNPNNGSINNTLIDATIISHDIASKSVEILYEELIKMGISISILLFISISTIIIYKAITYKVDNEKKSPNEFTIFGKTVNVIEVLYIRDVFERTSFLFLFSAIDIILIFYLLISYYNYLLLLGLLTIPLALLLFFFIFSRIYLRLITGRLERYILYSYALAVIWVCLLPYVLLLCLVLSVIRPEYVNLLASIFNNYFIYGSYYVGLIIITLFVSIFIYSVNQTNLNLSKAKQLLKNSPISGLIISTITGALLGLILSLLLLAGYNFTASILSINTSTFAINWTWVIVGGTIIVAILGNGILLLRDP